LNRKLNDATQDVFEAERPFNQVYCGAVTDVKVEENAEHDPDGVFHRPEIKEVLVTELPHPRE
jgi:hypothetical protein